MNSMNSTNGAAVGVGFKPALVLDRSDTSCYNSSGQREEYRKYFNDITRGQDKMMTVLCYLALLNWCSLR